MKVIDIGHSVEYNELVKDFDAWLYKLSTESLPGGVAAAAVAAAMGAALVAKAARITMHRQVISEGDREVLRALLDLARGQHKELLRLARADERAYRAVLKTRATPATLRQEAWQRAIEVPLSIAEACRSLLDRLPPLYDTCWPAAFPDLEVGGWLLETGGRATLSVARSNLKSWELGPEAQPLWARAQALSFP